MQSFACRLAQVLLAGGLATGASAQTPPPAAPPAPAAGALAGYLPAGDVPAAAPMLGPPPAARTGTATGDLATFEITRKKKVNDTERWNLATRDAVYGADAMLQDFSCALGVQLTPANAQTLDHMLGRVAVDADHTIGPAKVLYRRRRPYLDHQGPICVAREAWMATNWSYPSGHSTYSWTVGLILAEIAPDHAAAILGRARVYGESRVVCGVHYTSDVDAGRVAASAVFSALQVQPEFQRNLQAARADIKVLRTGGGTVLDADECRIEADAQAHPVW